MGRHSDRQGQPQRPHGGHLCRRCLRIPGRTELWRLCYYDENGNITKYNYVTYEEGIYVGYRYYETRYEDTVLGQGNAGDYDYAKEVIYPFGYGLSYTSFDWSDFKADWSGDTCTAQVTVTNTGDVSGKDVVEVYVQSPTPTMTRQTAWRSPPWSWLATAKPQSLPPAPARP